MAISLASIRKGGKRKPPRLLIYGVPGIGKTSFAASAPSPIFLRTEDGLDTLQVPAFEFPRGEGVEPSQVATSYAELIEAMGVLYNEAHEFKTIVFDSLDWLEPLIWADVCKENGVKSIEDIGYGKGYIAAINKWRAFLDGVNMLRDDRGMAVIFIGHSVIKRFDAPDTEPYDQYRLKLHAAAAALVMEHCDAVFFANYRTTILTSESGFGQKKKRGAGGGERIMYTEERPAFLAKNRFSLPTILPLSWAALEAGMKATDVPSDGANHPVADLTKTADETPAVNALGGPVTAAAA